MPNDITVAEAARKLGVGIDHVYKLIYSDKLLAIKQQVGENGRHIWRISLDSLRAYQKRRKHARG